MKCRYLEPRAAAGFSLVEILLVTLIVGILLAIAAPGYQQANERARRLLAGTVLNQLWAAQEAYFSAQGEYALALSELGMPEPYYVAGSEQTATPGRADYRLVLWIEEERYRGFLARPVNGQRDDACGELSITRLGMTSAVGTERGLRCW